MKIKEFLKFDFQEEKEDRDDEEEIARKRAWDEYTDEHKRGEGNRHNMGWKTTSQHDDTTRIKTEKNKHAGKIIFQIAPIE